MNSSDNFENVGEIAIVGMSGRFPGAKDVEEFWRNLRAGVESISFDAGTGTPPEHIDPELLKTGRYVRASAPLPDMELFDASFFGFTRREAEITDPQQRLFLECAWEALESAGYDAASYEGRVGVYAGASASGYFLNVSSHPVIVASVGEFQIELGNDKDYLATRTSYKLNLRGPSITIQTACSTSLVAVHVACQGLLDYECDVALAGGVSVRQMRGKGYIYQQGGILSPDGHCKAFDAEAEGTIVGNGLGLVVLKRLQDALDEGDTIHAVIKGSAINNDGSFKVGFTAPSVEGQAEAVARALANAGVEAETINYVEAHGTATPLGDPVEIAALTKAFRASTARKKFCAVGSVKTNIGHLNTAAGVAGLIKTVLALKHRAIPPSLHFQTPNPKIDFESSPFYVNARLNAWPTNGTPRRAGVSSFGIGGTNAHVILEEATPQEPTLTSKPQHILMLSARSEAALEKATANLVAYLKQHPEASLADVAYTLQVGRAAFKHRRFLICENIADAVQALDALAPARVESGVASDAESHAAPVGAFTSPAQDAQDESAAHELSHQQSESDYKHALENIGRRWLSGHGVDRAAIYRGERRRRLPLPTYPFERERFWIEHAGTGVDARAVQSGETTQSIGEAADKLQPSEPVHTETAAPHDVDDGAPRNVVERILVELWQEAFGVERVSINDRFLELGGHSLLAVQLITRVRNTFQIELPLQLLFDSPTIAELAQKIMEQQLSPDELEEIEQIFGEIGRLSSDEVKRQLAAE